MRGGSTRFKPGLVPWNKTEHIKKQCPTCGGNFAVRPSCDRIVYCSRSCVRKGKPSPNKGKTASAETREKQRKAKLGIRGPAHWNFKNGADSERHRAMARDEYKQWRSAVFERDDFTCQKCGGRGVELHADHILSWARHPEHRFDIDNGRTLCVPCHWSTPTFPKRLIPKEYRR